MSTGSRLRRHGGLLLTATCFAAYLLLAQESGYGDVPGAILEIRAGNAFEDPIHYLYMPMVLGMSRLLGWLGISLSLFQAGYVLSALAACCPAVVFFATAMEYHGPFLAFSALATWTMVSLVQQPRWYRAAVVGLATGLAYLAHASAHLLPLFMALCFVVLSRRPRAPGGSPPPGTGRRRGLHRLAGAAQIASSRDRRGPPGQALHQAMQLAVGQYPRPYEKRCIAHPGAMHQPLRGCRL